VELDSVQKERAFFLADTRKQIIDLHAKVQGKIRSRLLEFQKRFLDEIFVVSQQGNLPVVRALRRHMRGKFHQRTCSQRTSSMFGLRRNLDGICVGRSPSSKLKTDESELGVRAIIHCQTCKDWKYQMLKPAVEAGSGELVGSYCNCE